MADAPKLTGKDTLRTAYPKINAAIDNANEAFKKSASAVSTSNIANDTANNALADANKATELATTANEKTDSFQSQLDQLSIEGDSSVEAAQARVTADGTTYTTLQQRLNEADSLVGAIKLHKESNSKLLSAVLKKIYTRGTVKIVCQGDSMTYSQDTISGDSLAPTGTADNGDAHTQKRALITYPEKLKAYLDEIYPSNSISVINKGYSGDWVGKGLVHWVDNESADLAFLMYGTNDADLTASWVPSDVKGNIDRYIQDYRTLIDRYLKWGTALVILTPPRQLNQEQYNQGRVTEAYRNALLLLGKEYNIPVIDAEEFSNGWDKTYYCDTTHFNSKGYSAFASRVASLLVGFGIVNKENSMIDNGKTLSIRTSRENIVYNDVWFTDLDSALSYGPEEINNGEGLILSASSGNCSMYFAFYTNKDNMIFIPTFTSYSGQSVKFTLDFDNEQGSIPLLSSTLVDKPQGYKPPSSITSGINESNPYKWLVDDIGLGDTNKYLWVTNKGWHIIKVEGVTKTISGGFAVNGFSTVSYEEFAIKKRLATLEVRKNVLHKPLYSSFSSTPATVTSIQLTPAEINSIFTGNQLNSNEYYKGIPLKIVLHNPDDTIIEHGFIWHDNGTGTAPNGGFYSWFIKTQNLVPTPTSTRTILGVTYNSTDRVYTINFGGVTNKLGNITVKQL